MARLRTHRWKVMSLAEKIESFECGWRIYKFDEGWK